MAFKLSPATAALLLISLTFFSPQGAQAVTWSIDGPGTTSVSQDGNTAIFTYSKDVRRFAGQLDWEVVGLNLENYENIFHWSWTGNHDYRQHGTYLTLHPNYDLVNSGTFTGQRSRSFSYTGQDTFRKSIKPQNAVLLFGGMSDDTTRLIHGQLIITMAAVPTPGTLMGILSAIGALIWLARRRPA